MPKLIFKKDLKDKLKFNGDTGIILGSGLSPISDSLHDKRSVHYNDIEDFPISTVSGHNSDFVSGYYKNNQILFGNPVYYKNVRLDKNINYDKLDENGFIREGESVTPNDAIMTKFIIDNSGSESVTKVITTTITLAIRIYTCNVSTT